MLLSPGRRKRESSRSKTQLAVVLVIVVGGILWLAVPIVGLFKKVSLLFSYSSYSQPLDVSGDCVDRTVYLFLSCIRFSLETQEFSTASRVLRHWLRVLQ